MFIDHASCTLTAQVLKEYEKTISELIADKERDKKALEAEVQLFSLTKDFCFHVNLAFIGLGLAIRNHKMSRISILYASAQMQQGRGETGALSYLSFDQTWEPQN